MGNDTQLVVQDDKPKSVVQVASQLETDDLISAKLLKQKRVFEAQKNLIAAKREEYDKQIKAFQKEASEIMNGVAMDLVKSSFTHWRAAFKAIGITAKLKFEAEAQHWDDDLKDPDCTCEFRICVPSGKSWSTKHTEYLQLKRPSEVTKLLKQVDKILAMDTELKKMLEKLMREYGDIHSRREEARISLLRWKGEQEGGEEIKSIVNSMLEDTPEELEQQKALAAMLGKNMPALPAPAKKK